MDITKLKEIAATHDAVVVGIENDFAKIVSIKPEYHENEARYYEGEIDLSTHEVLSHCSFQISEPVELVNA